MIKISDLMLTASLQTNLPLQTKSKASEPINSFLHTPT